MESVTFCPVPEEQQPVNEYQQLKESWFFIIPTLNWLRYMQKLTWVWLWSWLISGPLTMASFPLTKYPLKFAICGSAGASLGVLLVMLRLYLGWCYISDRLSKSTVVYEESGWYDGQTWTKPESVLTRDRLIVTYQIQPILHKLKFSFFFLTLIYCIGVISWMTLS